jgi:hypothetical protein
MASPWTFDPRATARPEFGEIGDALFRMAQMRQQGGLEQQRINVAREGEQRQQERADELQRMQMVKEAQAQDALAAKAVAEYGRLRGRGEMQAAEAQRKAQRFYDPLKREFYGISAEHAPPAGEAPVAPTVPLGPGAAEAAAVVDRDFMEAQRAQRAQAMDAMPPVEEGPLQDPGFMARMARARVAIPAAGQPPWRVADLTADRDLAGEEAVSAAEFDRARMGAQRSAWDQMRSMAMARPVEEGPLQDPRLARAEAEQAEAEHRKAQAEYKLQKGDYDQRGETTLLLRDQRIPLDIAGLRYQSRMLDANDWKAQMEPRVQNTVAEFSNFAAGILDPEKKSLVQGAITALGRNFSDMTGEIRSGTIKPEDAGASWNKSRDMLYQIMLEQGPLSFERKKELAAIAARGRGTRAATAEGHLGERKRQTYFSERERFFKTYKIPEDIQGYRRFTELLDAASQPDELGGQQAQYAIAKLLAGPGVLTEADLQQTAGALTQSLGGRIEEWYTKLVSGELGAEHIKKIIGALHRIRFHQNARLEQAKGKFTQKFNTDSWREVRGDVTDDFDAYFGGALPMPKGPAAKPAKPGGKMGGMLPGTPGKEATGDDDLARQFVK